MLPAIARPHGEFGKCWTGKIANSRSSPPTTSQRTLAGSFQSNWVHFSVSGPKDWNRSQQEQEKRQKRGFLKFCAKVRKTPSEAFFRQFSSFPKFWQLSLLAPIFFLFVTFLWSKIVQEVVKEIAPLLEISHISSGPLKRSNLPTRFRSKITQEDFTFRICRHGIIPFEFKSRIWNEDSVQLKRPSF